MKKIFIALLLICRPSSLMAGSRLSDSYEQRLLDTIKKIQTQNHELALDSTRKLIKQYLHSRLGHLLYADLLFAKAKPLNGIGSGISTVRALKDFKHEIDIY